METSRRAFVRMSVAAAAVAGIPREAAAAVPRAAPATTDPMKAPFARFWIAALTPVDRQGNFDNGANDAMLAWWKAQGADGVLLLGTTGEGQSFSVAERKAVLEQAAKNKHGLDFIIGAGAANAPETIELCRHAADNGADSVLVVPPYYDKNPRGEGVIAYFDKVFAAVKSPVNYYHIPRTTGVPVEPSVFKALSKYPNLVGLKDSNGDAAEFEAITAALPDRNVVTGTDNLLENALGHGHGCILASGNVFTRQVAAVFAAYRAKQDYKAAILRLTSASQGFRTAVGAGGEAINKYALSLMVGIREMYVRPPSMPLDESLKPKIEEAVKQLKSLA